MIAKRKPKTSAITDGEQDKLVLRDSWRRLVNYLGLPGHSLSKSFTSLMESVPTNPKDDLLRICQCWLELTGAKWIWLWMMHDLPGENAGWQIQSTWPDDVRYYPNTPKANHDCPKANQDCRAVVHWCTERDRVLFVPDVQKWVRHSGKIEYRVLRAKEIESHGAVSFLCIPLLFPSKAAIEPTPSGQDFSVAGAIRGGMCIHLDERSPKIASLPQPMLQVIAKATTLAIANSFGTSQRRILNELDLLAARFTTRADLRATRQRSAYLAEVIKLIKKHLGVQFVTFLYRTAEGSEVECIATTGLEHPCSDGRIQKLPKTELWQARYKKEEESVTGRVFKTGQPFVCQADRPVRLKTKVCSWRETPCTVPEDSRSWVVWPIKTPMMKEGRDPSRSVLGIIRCVDNRQPDSRKAVRAFDPVQLQTLNFIAAQLAPILAAMAFNIERETMIDFIKHDLINPMLPVNSHIAALEAHFRGKGRIPRSAVSQLRAAVFMEQNLAQALSAPRNFQPAPVNLRVDVVAQMKDGISHFAWVEKRMKIVYTNFERIPWLHLDRDLVGRAVTNLLTNAVKYGDKGSTIRVEARVTASKYVIEVINDGPGVADEDVNRIFLGSYRAPKARELTFGGGHGLKIARSIMRRHRGDLRLIRSRKPTIFAMSFPKTLAC